MSDRPSLWTRASDYFLVRRANQTIIALFVLGAMIVVVIWWIRNGGLEGELTNPMGGSTEARKAEFVVNLNTAEVGELVELPGVGEVIAERIVERRKTVGPYKSVEELLEIRDIGAKKLDAIRPHVKVE